MPDYFVLRRSFPPVFLLFHTHARVNVILLKKFLRKLDENMKICRNHPQIFRYGLYVALHKGYDKMGSGSDSRYFIHILQ